MSRVAVMSGMVKVNESAGWLRRLGRCRSGVSSIELALLAPIIIVGLLMMVDAGLAVATRMEMDRNVRAGAQAAMSLNNSAASIEEIVRASAEEAAELDVAVALTCGCAGTPTSCTSPCASGAAPSVFVSLSAAREFSGLLVSNLPLRSESRVQIR
jgi:Flp pilus assembly protein TadG